VDHPVLQDQAEHQVQVDLLVQVDHLDHLVVQVQVDLLVLRDQAEHLDQVDHLDQAEHLDHQVQVVVLVQVVLVVFLPDKYTILMNHNHQI
jgi:hypothetical protein